MRRLLLIVCGVLPLAAQPALSLPEAIRQAWQRHPSVAAAQAAVRSAAARTAGSRAARLPRVDFAESATRSDHPVFVFGSLLTQRQFTAANFALPSLNQPDFLNNFQSLLRAEQTLWDGGRSRTATELAALQEKRAALTQQEVELGLAARTARAYLDVLLAEAAVPAAEQAIRSAEASLAQARAVRDAGRSTDADALALEAHLAQAQDLLLARRAQSTVARAALNELTGLPLDATPVLTSTLAAMPLTAGDGAQRPEQALARLETDVARKRRELARAAWLPTVHATAAFEADRQRFVTRGGANWTAGVALQWRLYDGGARAATQRAATEDERAAAARSAAIDAHVQREVFQARALLESAQTRVASATKGVAASQENLRITRDRYGAGLNTVTDLLRAETAALEADFLVLGARHNLRAAGVNLAAAQGRLSPDAEVLQ
jgi:outer membrane protein